MHDAAVCAAPALREDLLRMFKEDQESLSVRSVHHYTHKIRLKEIISQHGWPTRSLVGSDGALTAWIIVQHDDELPWMIDCLRMITRAATSDEARLEDVAYLTDRILLMEKKLQRYGTQCVPDMDGTVRLAPLEDPENVNERRRSMGIPEPVEEYLETMRSRK